MDFGKVIMLRETTEQSNKINHYFLDTISKICIMEIVDTLWCYFEPKGWSGAQNADRDEKNICPTRTI